MRILTLGINYWPEQTGIGPFTTWRCEYLASCGHEVSVCTSFPYYPLWRVPEEYRGKFWQKEERNGVGVLRSWIWVPRRVTSVRRILHEASFLASSLARAFTARKPDLLMIESPPLGLAVSANLLSRWWGIPYVYDVMDLQPDAAADLGMLPPGKLLRFLYGLERVAYRNASLVSTLTEGMRQRIIDKQISPEKVMVFPPRAEEDLFRIRRDRDGRAFRQAHGLGEDFLVLHSGNMGVKQGLEVVLKAAALSRDEGVTYLLVGDGAMKPALEAQATSMQLKNVRFLPLQDRDAFLSMLAACDLSLVTQQRTVSDILFPSKTVTALASGCPVIASVNHGSEIARVIKQSKAGIVIEPENPNQLHETVQQLRIGSRLRAEMSVSGRRYARVHWDGAKILPAMERELVRLAGKAPLADVPEEVSLGI